MKLTVYNTDDCNETEITIRCKEISQELANIISYIELREKRLACTKDGSVYLISPEDVYYFESVDDKVFAYTHKDVCEISMRLYEAEEKYGCLSFFRISKSVVVNLNKVKMFKPSFNSRIEILLDNNEHVVANRQYTTKLKERFGIK